MTAPMPDPPPPTPGPPRPGTRLLALAAGLLLVGACSAPEHGQVVSKEYHAPYSWIQMVCTMHDPKAGYCTMSVPLTHNEPARWELCLRDGDDEGCRNVDETTFHQYPVGSQYGGVK